MAWIRLLLLLFSYVECIQTKLFPLTPGWQAYTLLPSYSFSNGQFYPLLTSRSNYTLITSSNPLITSGSNYSLITSSNSTYALGLFSPDFSKTVTMIICLLPFNSSYVIDVWNVGIKLTVNDPVLRVSEDKSELQLLDADNNAVWSIGGYVSALELTESGNLIVYNSSQNVIWQSFDHPTDTFLPGQTLTKSTPLTASNSSSFAKYSMVIEPSGLVLYSTDTSPYLPYSVFTVAGANDYSKAMENCGDSGMVLTYIPKGIKDIAFFNGSACNNSYSFEITFEYSSKFRLIRLDSDGNLRHYLWKEGTLRMNLEAFSQQTACYLPEICGSYGICSKEGQCNCPSQSSSSSLAAVFHTSGSKTKGCKPTMAVACDASSMQNQVFFNISNVTYFSNRYVAPLHWKEKDECVSSCLSNCSCLAAFYEDSVNQSTRACYHVSTHVSSIQTVSSGSQKTSWAYLKVQLQIHKKQRTISHTLVIIVSIVAATSFLVLVGVVGFIIRYCIKEKMDIDIDILTTVPGVPCKFSYKELEIATDGFKCVLGTGGFGTVFRGKLKDGRSVAVKKLTEGATQGSTEFEAEVRTLGGIDHKNLVQLYGFCIEGTNRLLVYECMPNGSLNQWLFADDSKKVLSWTTRIDIAMDVAQGLEYLHEGCNHPVLHLDIKPQNILLGRNFKAKVSDLGMAKLINQEISTVATSRSSSNLGDGNCSSNPCDSSSLCNDNTPVITHFGGTPGYIAPELFTEFKESKKCDIYSYGIVLLEIVSGRRVCGRTNGLVSERVNSSSNSWYLPSWVYIKAKSGNITEIVDPRLHGNFEHDKAKQIIRLACCCIDENADHRPTVSQIIQALQGTMEVSETTFKEPHLSMHVSTSGTMPYFTCSSNVHVQTLEPNIEFEGPESQFAHRPDAHRA